jgi:hypothetical protein
LFDGEDWADFPDLVDGAVVTVTKGVGGAGRCSAVLGEEDLLLLLLVGEFRGNNRTFGPIFGASCDGFSTMFAFSFPFAFTTSCTFSLSATFFLNLLRKNPKGILLHHGWTNPPGRSKFLNFPAFDCFCFIKLIRGEGEKRRGEYMKGRENERKHGCCGPQLHLHPHLSCFLKPKIT